MGKSKKSIFKINEETKEKEVDFLELLSVLWSSRRTIIIYVFAFAILGLIHSFTSPYEYETRVTLMPESQQSFDAGALGGIAGIAGIDLNALDGGGGFNPDLFPNVLSSASFLDSLAKRSFFFRGPNVEVTLYEYFTSYSKSSPLSYILKIKKIPSVLAKWIAGDKPSVNTLKDNRTWYAFSEEEVEILKNLEERISVDINSRSGLIQISIKMQDPFVCAQVADYAVNYLTEYVINYHVGKELKNYRFIKERFQEARFNFEIAQRKLATYRDKNQRIATSVNRSEEERLESEFDVAFDLYKTLAQQQEKAKLKVQEETPVLHVLDPIQVPYKKSEPRRLLILILSSFIGGMFGIIVLFVKEFSFAQVA